MVRPKSIPVDPPADLPAELVADLEAAQRAAQATHQQFAADLEAAHRAAQATHRQFEEVVATVPRNSCPDPSFKPSRSIVERAIPWSPLAEQIAALQGKSRRETRGRKPKYDWARAKLEVLGAIYRGEEPQPRSLADIETMLGDWFAAHGDEIPGVTLIREHAHDISNQVTKEVGN